MNRHTDFSGRQQTSAVFWEKRPLLWATVLICTFSCIRLWIAGSGQLDLAQDEAQYWDWSRRLQLSYYSKGPLIAWLIKAGTLCFGDTELGVRLFAVVNNMAVQGMLFYWLAVLMHRVRLAFITLLLANTIPLFIVSGILMTTDNPLMLCWLLALICLHQAGERPQAVWPLAGMAVAFCCGILAKYTMLLMLPLALGYIGALVWLCHVPPKTLSRIACACTLGAVLGMVPILLWNMDNDFVSFRHVARLAGVSGGPTETIPLVRFDRFPEYLGGQLGLLLPWWLCMMLWQGKHLALQGWDALKHKTAFLEKGTQEQTAIRQNLLLCFGFWPLWLFFIFWSFHTRIYPNWSAMSYVAGIIIAGMGVERLLQATDKKSAGIGRRWLPVWAGLSLFACFVLHGQQLLTQLLPLPEKINPTVRLKGWSDLGRRLEEVRQTMPDPDRVFFFSDAYDVTAALAFYGPGQPVAYCADFGRRLSQYDFWPDPNGETFITAAQKHILAETENPASPRYGWSAVYVSRKPLENIPGELFPMFRSVGGGESFTSRHEGQNGRSFGIIPLQGYTGVWKRPSQGIY